MLSFSSEIQQNKWDTYFLFFPFSYFDLSFVLGRAEQENEHW